MATAPNEPKKLEDEIPAGDGYRWIDGPNGRRILQKLPDAPKPGDKVPEAFCIRNPGPNPRSYWPGLNSLVAAGQTVEVPPQYRLQILRELASGVHDAGIHAQTGEPYPAAMERSDAPPMTMKEYLDAEEKRAAKADELG